IIHSQLDHPNIIPFLGIFDDPVDLYPLIVLPFFERGSLQQLLDTPASGKIMHSMELILGMAAGVAYLHSQKPPIIHGYLHPGNILVSRIGNPVICDFGLSRIRHEISRSFTDRKQGGRVRFTAPELFDGERPREESDVFALAMIFLNTWTGQLPFPHITKVYVLIKILGDGKRPSSPLETYNLARPVTDSCWRLIQQMWAHDVTMRPSSGQVLDALDLIFGPCKFGSLQHNKAVTNSYLSSRITPM
ncbi:kinase-like protein, partial [Clavulina sp. PMI_390]